MVNILGGSAPTLFDGYPHVQARDPGLKVHLYGKTVRPGRKVGHVTAYGDDLADGPRTGPARGRVVRRQPRRPSSTH